MMSENLRRGTAPQTREEGYQWGVAAVGRNPEHVFLNGKKVLQTVDPNLGHPTDHTTLFRSQRRNMFACVNEPHNCYCLPN